MAAKGLGTCARQLLLELDELRSMAIVLPARETGQIRLRVVARPAKPLAQVSPTAVDEVINALATFALYGFPESHALSFALIAYARMRRTGGSKAR
jgi:error-prone DNA polymerase